MWLVAPQGLTSVQDDDGSVYEVADGIADVPDRLVPVLLESGWSYGALEFLRPKAIEGPPGKDSTVPGPAGANGKDAFELAKEEGFTGSRDAWLASLRAKDGKQGPPGPIGPMPKHEWKGTALRFEIAPGKWGKFVDLQGPPGGDGHPIFIGGGGGGSTQVQSPTGTGYWRAVGSSLEAAVSPDLVGIRTLRFDQEINAGNSGSAITINWTLGSFQRVTLTANSTINIGTFPGVGNYQLRIIQGASYAVSWAGTLYNSGRWENYSDAPDVTEGAGSEVIVRFYFDGTKVTQSMAFLGVDVGGGTPEPPAERYYFAPRYMAPRFFAQRFFG